MMYRVRVEPDGRKEKVEEGGLHDDLTKMGS